MDGATNAGTAPTPPAIGAVPAFVAPSIVQAEFYRPPAFGAAPTNHVPLVAPPPGSRFGWAWEAPQPARRRDGSVMAPLRLAPRAAAAQGSRYGLSSKRVACSTCMLWAGEERRSGP